MTPLKKTAGQHSHTQHHGQPVSIEDIQVLLVLIVFYCTADGFVRSTLGRKKTQVVIPVFPCAVRKAHFPKSPYFMGKVPSSPKAPVLRLNFSFFFFFAAMLIFKKYLLSPLCAVDGKVKDSGLQQEIGARMILTGAV